MKQKNKSNVEALAGIALFFIYVIGLLFALCFFLVFLTEYPLFTSMLTIVLVVSYFANKKLK